MKKVKIFRLPAAVIAALALCVGLTGCKVEFGTNPNAKDKMIAARPTAGENTEGMEITYGEFRKQYLYLLEMYGVDDDDDDPEVIAALRNERDDLIQSLIQNKIVQRKAREYGVDTLTEAELQEARETADAQIMQQVNYYANLADYNDINPWDITDEIREERGGKLFDELLDRCGLSRDDMLTWTKEYIISTKVVDAAVINVTMADAEAKRDELLGKVKELYETDPAAYENSGYADLWLPEGSRLIKHVLLSFDEELQTEIMIDRFNGDNEAADKLRAEGEESLRDQISEVQQKLDDLAHGIGTFNEIIEQYSADAEGSAAYPDGYVVVPNGSTYMEEFQKAAFIPEKIGDMVTCVTDYGIHFMLYAGNAKVSEENIAAFTSTCYGQLRQLELDRLLKEWDEEFKYDIDRELLRLDIGLSDTAKDEDGGSGTESSGGAGAES